MTDTLHSKSITNESELVKSLQSGNPQAIEALYTMYFDRLYAIIFHSVKQDQFVAEDIVQDVFVSAIRSAKGYKAKSKIYTWLASIAHHKIIDYYRRKKRESNHFDNSPKNGNQVNLQSIADNSQHIAESFETNEMEHVVAKALSNLPIEYQQVLLYKYIEEMTVPEISRVMKRSPKSIEGMITRARKLLKNILTGEL